MTELTMDNLPQFYLTQDDADRLLKLVESQPGKRYEKLEGELVRAMVVPREKIPEDVVTMNSRLGLPVGQSIDWELPGGEKHRYRIVKVPFQLEAAGGAR
jgi:transcription elongation GreA/GreB family factor